MSSQQVTHARGSIRATALMVALLFSCGGGELAAAEAAPAAATRSGEKIYTTICQGCHMPDGRGAEGAGRYPALTASPVFASAAYIAVTVLNGRRNMPSFAPTAAQDDFFRAQSLSDEEVANVVNYIRSHFGNGYTDTISAAEVTALPHP
jgi:mono/diheme cytochrome c family protein